MLKNILLVFFGGGLGSVARFGTMQIVARYTGPVTFPWHTFVVNVIGAFLIGIVMEFFALRSDMAEAGRLLLITGFLGGYTTFSAFSLENALLLQKGDVSTMVIYMIASVGLTLVAVLLGSSFIKAVL